MPRSRRGGLQCGPARRVRNRNVRRTSTLGRPCTHGHWRSRVSQVADRKNSPSHRTTESGRPRALARRKYETPEDHAGAEKILKRRVSKELRGLGGTRPLKTGFLHRHRASAPAPSPPRGKGSRDASPGKASRSRGRVGGSVVANPRPISVREGSEAASS